MADALDRRGAPGDRQRADELRIEAGRLLLRTATMGRLTPNARAKLIEFAADHPDASVLAEVKRLLGPDPARGRTEGGAGVAAK